MVFMQQFKNSSYVAAGLDLSNGIAEKFGKEGSSDLIRKRS